MPKRVIVIIVGAAGSGIGFALLYTAIAALLVYGEPGGLLVTLAQLIFALAVGWPFLVLIVWIAMLLKWPLIITAGIVWICLCYLFRAVRYTLEGIAEAIEGVVSWFSKP